MYIDVVCSCVVNMLWQVAYTAALSIMYEGSTGNFLTEFVHDVHIQYSIVVQVPTFPFVH